MTTLQISGGQAVCYLLDVLCNLAVEFAGFVLRV